MLLTDDMVIKELEQKFAQWDSMRTVPITNIRGVNTLSTCFLKKNVYKVLLADGRVFKARRCLTSREAERIQSLSRFLDGKHFPKVLGRDKEWLLIEWKQGENLGGLPLSDKLILEAAEIQAQLHTTFLPEGLASAALFQPTFWQNRLESRVHYLWQEGVISRAQREKILKLAAISSIKGFSVGLCHGDYCADHFILDKNNVLQVIDLETLSITSLAYGMARSAYRWPMSTLQRQVYLKGYRRVRCPTDFLTGFSFWILLVLVDSIYFHYQGQTGKIGIPLSQLHSALNLTTQEDLLERYGYLM